MAAEITDIERERQRRLQENAMRMKDMGLASATAQLANERAMAHQKQQHHVSSSRACKAHQQSHHRNPSSSSPHTPIEEIRRSSRVRCLPAPNYVPIDFIDEDGRRRKNQKRGATARRGRRGEGSGGQLDLNYGKVRVSSKDGWQHWMGVASLAASKEARQAAEELEEKLNNSSQGVVIAALKDMSESQVSGGFWCQLPKKFASRFNVNGSKYNLSLLMGDDEDDSTDVIFLPRPGNSAGLSGGWRTFAIEKRIFPNDTVVFEKVSEVCIKAHVFRAYDYDDTFQIGDSQSMGSGSGDIDERDAGDDGGRAVGDIRSPRTIILRTGGRKLSSGRMKRRRESSSGSEDDLGSDNTVTEDDKSEGQEEESEGEEQEEEDEEEGEEREEKQEEEGEVYEVDMIVGYCPPPTSSFSASVKRQKGPEFHQEMFRIRWKGYEEKDDTWEPRSSLDLPPGQYKWQGVQIPSQYRPKSI